MLVLREWDMVASAIGRVCVCVTVIRSQRVPEGAPLAGDSSGRVSMLSIGLFAARPDTQTLSEGNLRRGHLWLRGGWARYQYSSRGVQVTPFAWATKGLGKDLDTRLLFVREAPEVQA